MATLGLKEMGKFLWEGKEKGGKRREKGRAMIKKYQNLLLLAVGFEPTTIELTEWSPNQFCHLGL
jgi:hypothetical protein